jgi:hypothetical protein
MHVIESLRSSCHSMRVAFNPMARTKSSLFHKLVPSRLLGNKKQRKAKQTKLQARYDAAVARWEADNK